MEDKFGGPAGLGWARCSPADRKAGQGLGVPVWDVAAIPYGAAERPLLTRGDTRAYARAESSCGRFSDICIIVIRGILSTFLATVKNNPIYRFPTSPSGATLRQQLPHPPLDFGHAEHFVESRTTDKFWR